jgi:Protein of unknown function (DUF2568).
MAAVRPVDSIFLATMPPAAELGRSHATRTPPIDTLRLVNLAVRFFLELAALAAFAYAATTIDAPVAARAALAVLAPVSIAILWALFISPKARFSSGRLGQVGLGLIVFLSAATVLFLRGQSTFAIAFGVTAVVSSALLYALPQ